MRHVVVVGSGASAVHFAQSVLARGWRVTMLDVGRVAPAPVRPGDSFAALKEHLDDPADYFLGRKFEGVLFPGHAGEYYGFPPHKGYIFEGVGGFDVWVAVVGDGAFGGSFGRSFQSCDEQPGAGGGGGRADRRAELAVGVLSASTGTPSCPCIRFL